MKKNEELKARMSDRYNEVSFCFNCQFARWLCRGESSDWNDYQILMGEMQALQLIIKDIMDIYGMKAEYDLKRTEIMIEGEIKEISYEVIRIIE